MVIMIVVMTAMKTNKTVVVRAGVYLSHGTIFYVRHSSVACVALSSSFVFNNSGPIYLCMFVRKIRYLTWRGSGLVDFDESYQVYASDSLVINGAL